MGSRGGREDATMRPMMRLCPSLATLSFAAFLCASCSSPPPPPDGYITSTLGTSTSDPTSTSTCNINAPDSPFITIGTAANPVADGTSFGGTPIQVDCQVHSTGGNSYDVDLSISEGPSGGLGGITLSGTLTTSTGPQTTITSAAFNKTNQGEYSLTSGSQCTVTLSTETSPAITAGRVWGSITCPTVTFLESNATCYATATFIFQNCQQ